VNIYYNRTLFAAGVSNPDPPTSLIPIIQSDLKDKFTVYVNL